MGYIQLDTDRINIPQVNSFKMTLGSSSPITLKNKH